MRRRLERVVTAPAGFGLNAVRAAFTAAGPVRPRPRAYRGNSELMLTGG